jgi:hypothetical protein
VLGRRENARGTWDDTVAHFVDAMMTRENGKQWNGEREVKIWGGCNKLGRNWTLEARGQVMKVSHSGLAVGVDGRAFKLQHENVEDNPKGLFK